MTQEQDRYEVLVTKAVDGVLTDEESQEFTQLLDQDPNRLQEFNDFKKIKSETDLLSQRILASAKILPARPSTATQVGLQLSFGLIFLSFIGAIAVEMYFFFVSSDSPLFIKILGGLFGAGFTGLCVHVFTTRSKELKYDPYKEIDR